MVEKGHVLPGEVIVGTDSHTCINVGLLPIECTETGKIKAGHTIELDYKEGKILNKTTGETYRCSKIPLHISAIADHGGLIGYIKAKRGSA